MKAMIVIALKFALIPIPARFRPTRTIRMKPALLAVTAQPSKPVGPATTVTQNSQVHACAQPPVLTKSAPNLQTLALRLKFARLAV